MNIYYVSKRGETKGRVLFPSRNKGGNYVVSKTRYSKDQIEVSSLEDAVIYLKRKEKFGIRMVSKETPKYGPSLIFNDLIIEE